MFFASDASAVHFSYRRYLENRLREKFGFDGTPIRLVFRDRSSVKLPRRKKLRSAPVASAKGAAPRRSRQAGSQALMDGPRVAVVGAGAWGTTLARVVARVEPVTLLCHSPETAARIRETGRNEARLPGRRPAGDRRRDRRPGRAASTPPTS